MKILIVEDDQKLADFLNRALLAEGYATDVVSRVSETLTYVRAHQPDLILLDRLLEDGDGLQVCRDIRHLKLPCKILMLSALSEVEDRVLGLRGGADDYLGKPFHFEELLARIEALSQRDYFSQAENLLNYVDLSLNLDHLELTRAGQLIELTAKELRIMEMLLRNPGRVLSRERILSHVWGVLEDPMTNIVDVYMARLRRKIDDGFELKLIKTRRGLGYLLSDRATS
ncbi:DNA-binding response regulator [Nitrincola tibetensis]|uniref:DNA-binding response regulator n=1 Tax=Nitrincola tibetensis TaxID=2219697 RepID=A0A364NIA3_9GAMM|nr:response regulator transcription factor [Nitrincola tibetensis]RAU16760.1 DNA-binding response regulator [Nitrincola tibetensis]